MEHHRGHLAGELVVDTFQGPGACLVLALYTGMCWAGVDRAESLLL